MDDPTQFTNEHIDIMLSTLTSIHPDNNQIKQSTEALKKFSEHIQSVEMLLYQMKNNQNGNNRQLAGVVLYKCIDKHWQKIPQDKQLLIKTLLIELYSKETTKLALKAIAHVIMKICKQTLLNKEWDTLLDIVFANPSQYNTEQQLLFELNLYIISELISSSMEYLKHKLNDINNILTVAFSMGNTTMKENATVCLGNLISSLEKNELLHFKQFNNVLFKEIGNFNEKTIHRIYETLCDFQINSLYFFEDNFDIIIPITIQLVNNADISANTKIVLCEFMIMIAKYKKKTYTKNANAFLKELITLAFTLLSNPLNEHETDLYSETSLFKIGANIVNSLSNIISSKHMFPLLSTLIKNKYLSDQPWERRAAIVIIGEMAEGCATLMKDNIEDIITLLIARFEQEPLEQIKGQCVVSMDSVCQFCNPEINEYYDKIMPMLIKGLYSTNEDIVEKSLIEINYFCSIVDFEMEDYLNMNQDMNKELLMKLIDILNTNTKSMWIVEKCLDALGSVITNAKGIDVNTLIPIVDTLKSITINKNTENDQKLIGSTLNCIANIANVIKYNNFKPYEEYFTVFALQCIKSNVYDLQYGGLSYFASLADCKGDLFGSLINDVIQPTFNIIKDNSGIVEKAKAKDEFAFDSDSEDEMAGNGDVYWNEDFIEAKCSALRAVGSFAKASPSQFVAYFKDAVMYLEENVDYVCESVVYDVVGCYEALLISLDKANKDINGNCSSNMNAVCNFWTSEVFPKYVDIIESTDDQELVSEVICSIYVIVDHYGKDIFNNNNTLQRCVLITKKLLNNEMPCQIKNEDADEDELDHEEDIIDSVKNLCLILSEKLQNEFHVHFAELFPLLSTYLKPSHPEDDRSLSFGIIADVLKYTTISTKFYIEALFNHINANLSIKKKNKKNENLLRHIAYLIGIFFASDTESSMPYLDKSLTHLQFIYEHTKKEGRDNVIAALCRIIKSVKLTPSSSTYFDKLVDTIMTSLPLKYDPLENITVFELFEYLLNVFTVEHYTKHIESIMKLLQIIVVNDVKCKTKEEDMKRIHKYIETISNCGGNGVVKAMINEYINAKFTVNEKEKFVNVIDNAK